jgi:membrane associated rhomboid family serine protease
MTLFQAQMSGTYYRPRFFGGFSFFPPVIKALLISNVALWLLTDVFLTLFTFGGVRMETVLTAYFALQPIDANFLPWQLVTYMFMHGGFGHLFFNMLALWMFGMELEHRWGSRRFLIFYLTCGVGAGVANMIVAPLIGQLGPTVGASGAVFGVLVAFGMIFPDRPIYVYFLLPVRAKYFVAIYMAMELFYGVSSTGDGIAHFAHLGGAAVGFLFVLVDRGTIPLKSWIEDVRGPRTPEHAEMGRFGRKREEVFEAKFYDIKTGQRKKSTDITQEDIDAILDKISVGGYQSLTEDEKRILNEASKRMN